MTEASALGQTWNQSFAQTDYTDIPNLTEWRDNNNVNLALTSGNICN
jgi:hypothetical protein